MHIIEKDTINVWLDEVEETGFKQKNSKLWKNAYRYASKPRRQRVKVNLNRLDSIVNEGDHIVIPGKILGVGKVTKKFTVSALEYSGSASEKLIKAGCKTVPVSQMLSKKEVRLVI